jgi:uncharacterized protein (TIGR03435 family)
VRRIEGKDMLLIARCGTSRSFWQRAAFLLTAASLGAQTPAPIPGWQKAAGGKLEFEVASVRPSKAQSADVTTSNLDLDPSDYFRYRGGPIRTTGNLAGYIALAYKIQDWSQGSALYARLPKWAQSESFTVEARSPVEKPTKDQIRLMMQSLLAERFGLRLHTEIKEQPVYALRRTAPGKPGLQQHPEEDKLCADPFAEHPKAKGDPYQAACMLVVFDLGDGLERLRIMDYTMTEIAGELDGSMARVALLDPIPIVDQTGLTGHYDLSVNFAMPTKAGTEPGQESAEPGLPFIEALKQQAGLELVKTTAPVTTYIIDELQEPTPN